MWYNKVSFYSEELKLSEKHFKHESIEWFSLTVTQLAKVSLHIVIISRFTILFVCLCGSEN